MNGAAFGSSLPSELSVNRLWFLWAAGRKGSSSWTADAWGGGPEALSVIVIFSILLKISWISYDSRLDSEELEDDELSYSEPTDEREALLDLAGRIAIMTDES